MMIVASTHPHARPAVLHCPRSPSQYAQCSPPTTTGRGRTHPPSLSLTQPTRRTVVRRAIATDREPADAGSAGAAGCPYTALSNAVGATLGRGDTTKTDRAETGSDHGDFPAIPGPPALSLQSALDVGSILTSGIHGAMLAFSGKYGPICRFANPVDLNGASSWVFLNSPENIAHVCAGNVRNYRRRYLPDIYKFATHEKGILGSQGEYNRRHRRLCQPAFANASMLRAFSSVVVRRSRDAAAQWAGSPAFVTDVSVQTQRLSLDIVGLVAFSHDFKQVEGWALDALGGARAAPEASAGADKESKDRLLWAVNAFGEVLAEIFITPMPILRLLDALGFPQLKTLEQASATMRESMLEVIADRRAALASGAEVQSDLLGSLLCARDDAGEPMTDEELWEDVHDIMGAGHETTATTVAALIYNISAHPEVEALVREELDTVLGGRAATHEDLADLQYLTQCVRETLRLYPAIPVFPREAAGDDVLPSGHRIDGGDVVFMSSYALGREARIWGDDVLDFDPERFSPAAVESRHRYAWLPFGAGPRMCLGANFAEMSVTLMAASLLQSLRFEPIDPSTPHLPVDYDITMNFAPTNGLHMRVHPLT